MATINKKGYYPNFNTLKINGYNFSLRKFSEVKGHDDSLPYVATLYINNKKVCFLHNDGWGGETTIVEIYNTKLFKEVENEIKGLPYPLYPWDNDTLLTDAKITLNKIQDITDYIAETIVTLNNIIAKYGKKTSIVALQNNKIIHTEFKGKELTAKLLQILKIHVKWLPRQ